jgi:hypothetical protein
MEVDVREYLKHRPTPDEIAERVAWFQDLSRKIAEDVKDPNTPTVEELMDAARPAWRKWKEGGW